MKRVLIICYHFPPMEGVGILRPTGFAKYLQEFGWLPTVLTVNHGNLPREELEEAWSLPGVSVVWTDYIDVIAHAKKRLGLNPAQASRDQMGSKAGGQHGEGLLPRLTGFVRELLSFPDEFVGWYPLGVRAGRDLLVRESFDALLSISPSETSHLIARKLKRLNDIPWVADLRDLWSDDHYRDWPTWKRTAARFIERRVLADAVGVVTVSQTLADKLAHRHPGLADRLVVVHNGFDPTNHPQSQVSSRHQRLELCYTGKLHPVYQDPSPLFQAIAELQMAGLLRPEQVRCSFYVTGAEQANVGALAAKHGVASCVAHHSPVSHQEALAIQQAAAALLLVQWTGPGGDGWLSAKLFEYLGARRPIMVLQAREGEVSRLVRSSGTGVLTTTVAEVKDCLLKWVASIEHTGRLLYKVDEDTVNRYTRQATTATLAELLDKVTVQEKKKGFSKPI